MEWDSERIIFNSEWNYFCFRKGPVKKKPGERKEKRKRDRGRKEEKERKGERKKSKYLNKCCKLSNKTILFKI